MVVDHVTVAFDALQAQVDEWVNENLPIDYPRRWPKHDATKVVREAIHGYQLLEPQEYLILDTPIVQRLRYIHQTALGHLVYPTASHTRFDHSLGVAKVAKDFGTVLLGASSPHLAELRLAGLLHDVGHCLFSHLSEGLMTQHFETLIQSARGAQVFEGKKVAFGEMLSYMIVTSPRFANLLGRVVPYYVPGANPDIIAQLIIGRPPPDLAFLGDIITGPFDADKMDYLIRDCYFTGIRADVDVPRVVLSATLLDRSRFDAEKYPRLNMVMRRSGVSNLEQVIFNKMLLYPSIYHHHKIRALECMVRGIFEFIWDDPERVRTHTKLRFASVKDFLDVSEHDFLAFGNQEPALRVPIQQLLNRELLERCLVISMDYIESPRAKKDDLEKTNTEEHPGQIRVLRELIWDYLPKKWRTKLHELWIDLPKRPPIAKEAEECFIDSDTAELTPLTSYLPDPRWVDSYQVRRWKGHVFYVADADHRMAANRAARRMMKDVYKINIWNAAATAECKIV